MEQLPAELLTEILSSFSLEDPILELFERQRRLRTLRNASMVSKTFNNVAEPLLYRTIDLNLHDCITTFPNLLQSLFLRPQRQRYVNDLYMRECQLDPSHHMPPYANVVSAELTRHMLSVIRKLHLPDRLRVDLVCTTEGRSRKNESVEAVAIVFICICSNLRCCRIDWGDFDPNRTLLMRVFRELHNSRGISLGTNIPLQRLRHVSLQTCDPWPLDRYQVLLQLPLLESVEVNSLDVQIPPHPTRWTSRVTKLDVAHDFELGYHELLRIFDLFPTLTSLTLRWRYMAELKYSKNVGDALRERGNSLLALHVVPIEADGKLTSAGSLASFATLRTLEIPGRLLLDDDTAKYWSENETTDLTIPDIVLPPSLEDLRIDYDDDHFQQILDALITNLLVDERFSRLQKITMRRVSPFDGDLGPTKWSMLPGRMGGEDEHGHATVLVRSSATGFSA